MVEEAVYFCAERKVSPINNNCAIQCKKRGKLNDRNFTHFNCLCNVHITIIMFLYAYITVVHNAKTVPIIFPIVQYHALMSNGEQEDTYVQTYRLNLFLLGQPDVSVVCTCVFFPVLSLCFLSFSLIV